MVSSLPRSGSDRRNRALRSDASPQRVAPFLRIRPATGAFANVSAPIGERRGPKPAAFRCPLLVGARRGCALSASPQPHLASNVTHDLVCEFAPVFLCALNNDVAELIGVPGR